VGVPAPVIGRVDDAVLAQLIVPPADPPAPAKSVAAKAAPKPAPEAPAPPPAELDYADFAKVLLKSGKIIAAEKVAKADKLLKLTVEVGEAAPRTIVSGIAEAYTPEAVVGKNVVVVMNLKPRPLRGIESRGMLLTAGPGGKELVLLNPGEVPPGSEVK
jgi:methionyl-tRNA synthetase